MKIKIFGREPAVILGVAGALANWAVTLKLGWLDAGQSAAIIAVMTAGVIAYTTRPIAPAVITGVITAGAALFAEYGLKFSDESVTGLSSLLIAVLALFAVRPQVTPADDQVPISPAQGQVR